MELTGHYKITKAAVELFLKEFRDCSSSFVYRQLHYVINSREGKKESGLESYAEERDIIDVFTLGHWSNFAQKHHFMRRFDGQSPYQAYKEACDFIHKNALDFANAALQGNGNTRLLSLGHACHTLEDSFTQSHAGRIWTKDPDKPGPIVDVKIYKGGEGHKSGDREWRDYEEWWDLAKNKYSIRGKTAINGVKEFLKMIFTDVCLARKAKKREINIFDGWKKFKNTWLNASPKLSKKRDKTYDLIDKYYSGLVWGDTNHAFNFKEEELASAIYHRLGTNTIEIYNVFNRLNKYHTVDADDVAEYYVNMLRIKKENKRIMSISMDKKLKVLLIRILDEGWTSEGEKKCIDFLQSLGNSKKN